MCTREPSAPASAQNILPRACLGLSVTGWSSERSDQRFYFQMPEGSQNTGHAILDGLYELHDTVGTGGFAKVKVATHLQTGLKVGEEFISLEYKSFQNYYDCWSRLL